MKKLGMLGIIGGAALLTAVPFSLQWSQESVALSMSGAEARIAGASIEGSIAGHTAARLMQPQRLQWPDTAMPHIMAIALRTTALHTTPATTRHSRTRAITGP